MTATFSLIDWGQINLSSNIVSAQNTMLGGVITANSSNIAITYEANGYVAVDTRVAGGGGSPPGGSNTYVQFNNTGSFGGVTNLTWNLTSNILYTHSLVVLQNTVTVNLSTQNMLFDISYLPSATLPIPSANQITIFGENFGRQMIGFGDPSGYPPTIVGPHWGTNKIIYIGGYTGLSAVVIVPSGVIGITTTGTGTSRTGASGPPTSPYQSISRIGLVSTATAGANVSARNTGTEGEGLYVLGNTAGIGGLHSIMRFGVADASPLQNAMMFCGFSNTFVLIGNNSNTQTLANVIGVGQIPSSNTLHIITNGANTSGAVLDTGLQCNVGNANLWEVHTFAPPNAAFVLFSVQDILNPTAYYQANVTCNSGNNVPLGNTVLTPYLWRTNNNQTTAVAIDIASIYIETPY